MPKTTLRITGLHEIWVGITGLKNPIGNPLQGLDALQADPPFLLLNQKEDKMKL